MELSSIIVAAKQRRASDVHLEPGLPVTVRVSSSLLMDGEVTSPDDLLTMAYGVVGESQ